MLTHATAAFPDDTFKAYSTSPNCSEQILLDLPQALLVLHPDRRLIFSNSNAAGMLKTGYARDIGGRLVSIGQLSALLIEDLLRLALEGHGALAGLWFPKLQTGWLSATRMPSSITRGTDWPIDSLLLLIHLDDPKLTQQARFDALCMQCGLTRTERYVLLLLADGMAARDVARQLALQVSTIRSHIRNLLGKTRSPSLMQLVRRLGSTEPLADCL